MVSRIACYYDLTWLLRLGLTTFSLSLSPPTFKFNDVYLDRLSSWPNQRSSGLSGSSGEVRRMHETDLGELFEKRRIWGTSPFLG